MGTLLLRTRVGSSPSRTQRKHQPNVDILAQGVRMSTVLAVIKPTPKQAMPPP